MGLVIDLIDKRKADTGAVSCGYRPFGPRSSSHVWPSFCLETLYFGTANKLARILRYRLFKQFTLMSPSFYQRYRTGDLMAHATNDINAVTMFAVVAVLCLL